MFWSAMNFYLKCLSYIRLQQRKTYREYHVIRLLLNIMYCYLDPNLQNSLCKLMLLPFIWYCHFSFSFNLEYVRPRCWHSYVTVFSVFPLIWNPYYMISILWYAYFSLEIYIYFFYTCFNCSDRWNKKCYSYCSEGINWFGRCGLHGFLLFMFPILLWKLCICDLQL